MKSNQNPIESFSAGKAELEKIQTSLENEDYDIDQLETLIDRGTYLIEYLSTKLRNIETKLEESANK